MDNSTISILVFLALIGIVSSALTLLIIAQTSQRNKVKLLASVINATIDLHFDILEMGEFELHKTKSGRELISWLNENFSGINDFIVQLKKNKNAPQNEISKIENRYSDLTELKRLNEQNSLRTKEVELQKELNDLIKETEFTRNRIQAILTDSNELRLSDVDDVEMLMGLVLDSDMGNAELRHLRRLVSDLSRNDMEKLVRMLEVRRSRISSTADLIAKGKIITGAMKDFKGFEDAG